MKPIIGITMGDPAGIGPEILLKALTHKEIREQCVPLVYGSESVLRQTSEFTHLPANIRQVASPADCVEDPNCIHLLSPKGIHLEKVALGVVNANCGDAAFRCITAAIDDAMNKKLAAVVTGPINKEALNLAGHSFAGHTELFAHYTKTPNFAMLLTNGNLRIIHVTTHVSMREACDLITKQRVHETICLAWRAAHLMGIKAPVIGVAGLNAHASENGLFGSEEIKAILPAIDAARDQGICVEGPVPPDTVFVKALGGAYDIVVAMYHDQGHIPLKLQGFHIDPKTGQFTAVSGVNVTIGLPIIRTSVDHGTAFDRAGKNIANEDSMLDAICLAVQMAGRKEEHDDRADCAGG